MSLAPTFQAEAEGGERSWTAAMLDPTGLKTAATERVLDSARENTVYGDIENAAAGAAGWVKDMYDGLSPGMQKWAMFGALLVGSRMAMGLIPEGTPMIGNPLAKAALALVVGIAGSGGTSFIKDIFASASDPTSPEVAAQANALIGPPPARPDAAPEVAAAEPAVRVRELGAGMPS